MTPEFSRPFRLDALGTLPRQIELTAEGPELAGLAERFDFIALDALSAQLTLSQEGADVRADGQFAARLVQACSATGEPVPGVINEVFAVKFVAPTDMTAEAEIELDADALDVIEHDGTQIDLGEAIAQSLGLAIDPYVRAPDAEARLRAAGVVTEVPRDNPFAILKKAK